MLASFDELVRLAKASVGEVPVEAHRTLTEMQSAILSYSASLTTVGSTADTGFQQAERLCAEMGAMADSGQKLALVVQESANAILPSTAQALAASATALDAYRDSVTSLKAAYSRTTPESRRFLANAAGAIGTAEASVGKAKESLEQLGKQIPDVARALNDWQGNLRGWGRDVQSVAVTLRPLASLPLLGGKLASPLANLETTGDNLLESSETLRRLNTQVIKNIQGVQVSMGETTEAVAGTLKDAQSTIAVLSEENANIDAIVARSADRTLEALSSAGVALASTIAPQEALRQAVVEVADQTVKSLLVSKESATTMAAAFRESRDRFDEVVSQTSKVLAAATNSLTSAAAGSEKWAASVSNSLEATSAVLKGAHQGLGEFNPTQIEATAAELEKMGRTLRALGANTAALQQVATFLVVIGATISALMVVGGVQLACSGMQSRMRA